MHKSLFRLSNNKINDITKEKNKSKHKINYRNNLNQLNNISNNNIFHSYNNFISKSPTKNKTDFQIENLFIPKNVNLTINENSIYSNNFPKYFKSKQKSEEFNSFKNIIDENNDDDDDEILTKKYNEVKKLHKLFDENIELKKEIKFLKEEISEIKNINKIDIELINNKNSKLYENFKKMNLKINEMYETINNNNRIISKLNDEKFNLEQELIIAKRKIINNNDKIDYLNERCRALQKKINENNIKSDYNFLKTKKNEKNDSFIIKGEKNNFKNKNLKKIHNLILSIPGEKNNKINNLFSKIFDSSQKKEKNKSEIKDIFNSKNISNLTVLDNFKVVGNFENKIYKSSNKSFKSFNSPESIKDKNENSIEIKNKNIDKENDSINNDHFNIKYYQNKYTYYYKLYQDCKTNKEILEKQIKEKDELIKKLNDEINKNIENEVEENNNNSEINNNYKYNSNDYYIICDKEYGQLKWYLMKKQIYYEDNDSYDNLIWVPKIYISDINKFNEYPNEEENRNLELFKVIKKLEEKENIISKLTYKIDKLEKDIENHKNNSTFSDLYDELFVKTKQKNKNNKK